MDEWHELELAHFNLCEVIAAHIEQARDMLGEADPLSESESRMSDAMSAIVDALDAIDRKMTLEARLLTLRLGGGAS